MVASDTQGAGRPTPNPTARRGAAISFLGLILLAWSGEAGAQKAAGFEEIAAALAPELTLRAGRVTALEDGLALADFQLGSPTATDGVPVMRAARVVLTNPTLSADPMTLLTVEGAVFEDVEIRPASGQGRGTIEEIAVGATTLPLDLLPFLFDTDPDEDEIEDPEERARAVAARNRQILAIADAIGIAHISMTNLRTVEPRQEEDRPTAHVGAVTLEGIAEGRLDALSFEHVRIDDAGRVSLAGLRLGGLAYGPLLHHMLGPEPAAVAGEDSEEEAPGALARLAAIDPGVDAIELIGLAVDTADGEPLMRLEQAGITDITRPLGFPTSFNAAIRNLVLPPASLDDDEVEAVVAEMGYETVAISLRIHAGYDVEAQRLSLEEFSVDAREMVRIAASASITRFDLERSVEQLERFARTGVPPLPTLAIEGFSLSVTDESLIARLMDWSAARAGIRRADLADRLGTYVDTEMSALGLRSAVRDPITAAVRAFLDAGRSFSMRAAPETPVTVVELGLGLLANPQGMLDRLGFAVEAR